MKLIRSLALVHLALEGTNMRQTGMLSCAISSIFSFKLFLQVLFFYIF